MYGHTEVAACVKTVELTRQYPENRYEVAPYRYSEHSWGPNGIAINWGVKRYIPYCPAMPEKFDGFVWF
jgi:hypothetical protein